jgi:DHA2 family multidrug resistance protein-like MFS transporter
MTAADERAGGSSRETDGQTGSAAPERAGWVLASLILVAAVGNLNLAVANVALPDIGKHFDSSQTTLDPIAVAYSPALACSVLWFGALGGIARLGGGLSAGMAYPTTLSLITALWSGPQRTKPLCSGFLLEHSSWGSVFLLTLPLALVAIPMAWKLVPSHVNETTDPVDN